MLRTIKRPLFSILITLIGALALIAPGCAADDAAVTNLLAVSIEADAVTARCDLNAARLSAVAGAASRAPTIAVTTGGGATTYTLTGSDFAGTITYSMPGGPAFFPTLAVTFARPYAAPPVVVLPLLRHLVGGVYTTYVNGDYTLTDVTGTGFIIKVGAGTAVPLGDVTIWYLVVGSVPSLVSTAVG